MQLEFDGERLTDTKNFEEQIKSMLMEMLVVMRTNFPDDIDCWTWARCDIGDLSNTNSMAFEFGGDDNWTAVPVVGGHNYITVSINTT